jgi:hypothetical protein
MANSEENKMKPGTVDVAGHSPRVDLDALPDQQLFESVARNPAARYRLLAIKLLVERCSRYLRRPEIAEELAKLLADDPEKPEQPCQTN